ncbi:glycoside hydrolase family 2 protein [Sinorhizobium sp. BG8]|uniref:glycoside hydrolase family 2 protein n=1 Tax=Sinorhizobium sp. BG8 TaxID=2613773 RepID=UPI00193D24B6|nr:glycoside hydrolase family 2 protein [Sinorhizobium sp. BG8]QRM53732.1 glycoside hydrolase family 2 protein [Sinorhizobium sp. BG8]
MDTRPRIEASVSRNLTDGWTMALTPSGAWTNPSGRTADVELIDAVVPGTVAGALERARKFDRAAPRPLNHLDAWYFLDVNDEPNGPALLRLEGLATVAEVYWNDEQVLTAESMFLAHDVTVTCNGADRLAICFRALAPHLEKRGPRARWRPQMITPQGLRLVRTSLLGYMPGWCPEIHPVGPFRPIRLVRNAEHDPSDLRLSATLDEDGTGHLDVSFSLFGATGPIALTCAGQTGPLELVDGAYRGSITLPGVEPWWPHTHGRPVLHDIEIVIGGERRLLGRTGFRRVSIDRGADGRDFAVHINGEPIFCRGAVWTNADIVDLPGERAAYEPLLRLAAEAGMNMLRIGGTMTYETEAFFRLCDELGILVWQDFMFANFDYPVSDPGFVSLVQQEITQLLRARRASPSLAILCGGSEMFQQAAMLGLPETAWNGRLTQEILPSIAAAERPDLPFVENSPSGGAMPFSPNAGVTHYYGVGAYCRPLEDARRANVRFAAESLAFANVPEQETLDTHLPVPAVLDPRWKARVPRDRGASWDFEDIRDHYLSDLYAVDPSRLRREDPARYLDLSRAVSGEVAEAVFAEWRRPGSTCNGALVWTFMDLLPGAGWGLIDATGKPKPIWHALRRAFRPVHIALSDEGTNGLDIHVINETPFDRHVSLEVSCLRDGRVPVVAGNRELALSARESRTIAATDLFGAFFDTTYAFRFGPPAHEVTVARLRDCDTREVIHEAFHFPQGRSAVFAAATITAGLEQSEGWSLLVSTDRFVQSVNVVAEGYVVSDNWFHLAPGEIRKLSLSGAENAPAPSGEIRAPALASPVNF